MKAEEINRGQFLKNLGLSTKALMAFYCLGTVTACSTDDDPTPSGSTGNTGGNTDTGITGTSTGNSINFTINLSNTTYSKLKTAGEFAIIGDVIIANASGIFVALSKKCTHQGTTIEYRKDQGDFKCPNHGSEYTLSGVVQKGPTTTDLKMYKTALSADKNSLIIS